MRLACAGLLALALLAAGCRRDPDGPPPFDPLYQDVGEVADFTLTDQDGKTVRKEDLLGKVWVASFFYTCCTQGCATNIDNLAGLQRRLAFYPNVRFVSFSLLPGHDSQGVLAAYARDKGADPRRWSFLTGDEQVIHKLAKSVFAQSVTKHTNPEPGKEVGHTWRVLVVDPRGRICGYIEDGRKE